MRHLSLATLAFLLSPMAASPCLAAAMTRHDAAVSAAPEGAVVVLAARPGTPLDAIARQLVAQDLGESRRANDSPLILTGSASLGSASDRPALFVQLQSARECGSAGCATTIYLWQRGAWKRVLDGVGGKLTVAAKRTRGMSDLITDDIRYVWSGQEYRDSRPAPASVDLRRRR